MRVFILKDTTLQYNLVEIERIRLHDDKIVVTVAKWVNVETYSKHGNDYKPISKEDFIFECDYLLFENLLDEVYNLVGNKLPPHTIIKLKPHE